VVHHGTGAKARRKLLDLGQEQWQRDRAVSEDGASG
jgi:hypothetical protein